MKRSDCTNWEKVLVGDELQLVNGTAFKSSDWGSTGLPIVRIKNLNDPEAPFNYFNGKLSDKFRLYGGELLFAWSGTPGTSFGAHIWRGGDAWLNQHIFNVHFDETRWDKRFLRLAINQNLMEYIRAAHGAAGLAHITKGKFEKSVLPRPERDDQRQIVAEIEKQFSRLVEGVGALKRVQANLKRYRAAVLKAACEGQLVPGKAWPVRTVRDVTSIVTKGSSPNWQGFDYCEDGILFVRSQNIGWGKLDLSDVAHLPVGFNHKEKKSVLKARDVLLNIVGASIGRAAVATSEIQGGNVNQAVAVIRCKQETMLPEFLMVYLLSSATQALIHSQKVDVARANFSLEDIKQMPVPVPSLAEQTRIVAEVERRLSVVEELEATVAANLQRAARLRQSILQKAFAGELA